MVTKEQLLEIRNRKLAQARPEMTRAGAIAQGAAQGASFGFGDEIAAGLAAGGATLLDALQVDRLLGEEVDKSPQEFYEAALERNREMAETAAKEYPISYLGGNLAGGIGTGGLAASGRAGKALGQALGKGLLPGATTGLGKTANLATKVGLGAGIGGVTGAAYEFGEAEGGLEQRLKEAQEGYGLAAAVGGAFPLAGSIVGSFKKGTGALKEGFKARGAEALDETLEVLKKDASNAYQYMRDAGAVLSRDAGDNVGKEIMGAVNKAKIRNPKLHGRTLSVVDDILEDVKSGKIGLEELEQHRTVLGQIAATKVDQTESFAAGRVREALDGVINKLDAKSFVAGDKTAVDALKQGRAAYARNKKFESIASIIKKSDGDANYLKRELKKFLENPKKTVGFSKDELAALKDASKLSGGEAVGKMLGKFGFDVGNSRIGSGVGAVVGSGAGGAFLGPVGAIAVPAIGTAGRGAQKLLGRGKAERVLRTIEGIPQSQRGATPAISGELLLPATAGAPGVGTGRDRPTPPSLPSPRNLPGMPVTREQLMQLRRQRMQEQMAPTSQVPADLMRHEGMRTSVYKDTVGKNTVGIGFNMDSSSSKKIWEKSGIDADFDAVKAGEQSISPSQAVQLANTSYTIAVNDARSLFKNFDRLDPVRKKALANMSYQLGKSGLGGFKNLISHIESEQWIKAANSVKNSEYAKQVPGRAKEIMIALATGK